MYLPHSLCLTLVLLLLTTTSSHPLDNTSDPDIPIIRHSSDIQPDGSYSFAYETANGILAEEQGSAPGPDAETQPQKVQGQYQYTSPEGQVIRLVYEADENGFHPQGEHLPVGPEIPALIQRGLDYIASQESRNDYLSNDGKGSGGIDLRSLGSLG